MIKANELRIGNWVYTQSTKLVKDKTLPVQMRVVTKQEEHKYDPIHLTREILEKCGFELDGGGRFELNNVEIWLIVDEFKCALNPYLWVTLNYIHQLQNLYFALTGEELSIQL